MKVYIVGASLGYQKMFYKRGWELSSNIIEADLVQFTGGEDVSPFMYGEARHPCTYSNKTRDKKESVIFTLAHHHGKPMAGICRGGQFLNVLCGGQLYQDVDNHGVPHSVIDTQTGEQFDVTSTHHQMMRPGDEGEVVLVADRTRKVERMMKSAGNRVIENGSNGKWTDVEAVYYPNFGVFCFQPHPEFDGWDHLAKRYFDYIHNYLLGE